MRAPTSTPIIALTDCIGEVLAQATVRRPELAGRLAKASRLVDLGIARKVFPQGQDGCYYVESATEAGNFYLVNAAAGTCSCKWGAHGGTLCCHVLACRILSAASYLRNAKQRASDYGLPLSDPAADVARFVA